jgi:hypothetical protein
MDAAEPWADKFRYPRAQNSVEPWADKVRYPRAQIQSLGGLEGRQQWAA